MNILIIGSGGREHALGWKINQSNNKSNILFAPGNAGTTQLGTNIPVAVDDKEKLLHVAKKNNIDITLVGPETPLAAGIVDEFEKHNLPVFGPSKKAARLETSKAWATEFMKRHHIPHPLSYIFDDINKARAHINKLPWSSFVIKADGIAAGKGVLICANKKQAQEALDQIMVHRIFGDAGNKVVIQEMLEGFEISIIACADGAIAAPLLPAQDHKRAYDQDKGPNTGGMGAYAPVPFISQQLLDEINTTILQPTIDGMRNEGIPYKGMIYPGIMVTKRGPKVLEYNVRFGDPETQPQMMLLKSDLIEVITHCINGTLQNMNLEFYSGSALCVTLAASGYPSSYQTGTPIHGLRKTYPGVELFHAGTTYQNNHIVTSGGRVLSVAARGKDISEARHNAYAAIGKKGVWFKGMEYRTDIGSQAINI